ncbi:hypothetical protein E2C01_034842 [Portunus trituberculatus]|uniref:Uncharacterized protein n=1 Tax=Portunus trituberculatus TaxID=210409 RepID=A0A5B7F9U8_PORTR|nr:hypothetical protein [Portunus trituberculatus]
MTKVISTKKSSQRISITLKPRDKWHSSETRTPLGEKGTRQAVHNGPTAQPHQLHPTTPHH